MKTILLILIIAACTTLDSCVFTLTGYAVGSKLDYDDRKYDPAKEGNKSLKESDLYNLDEGEYVCVVTSKDSVIQGDFGGIVNKKNLTSAVVNYGFSTQSLQIKIDDRIVSVQKGDRVILPAYKDTRKYEGAVFGFAADIVVVSTILMVDYLDDYQLNFSGPGSFSDIHGIDLWD